MPAPRTPHWTEAELQILRAHYADMGIDVGRLLPARSWHSIHVKAHRLGLRSNRVGDAPKSRLQGEQLEEAIRLREQEGWSFGRIGAHFGVAEASASNAVLIALCPRRGYTPAERDSHGRLTEAGKERVRYALKKGLKGVDIQLRLGVSASCVAEQRRRYNRELKERGKAALPPAGGGEAYSGLKLTRAQRTEVEQLFMQGLGTAKISERTGVSKTSCTRIRTRLVKRLKRKGEVLPGCDEMGVRHVHADSKRFVTDVQKRALRAMLLDRIPVRRAAMMTAIGGSSAYRLRDELAAELAQQGKVLPPPRLPGRVSSGRFDQAYWPPQGPAEIFAFRELLQDLDFQGAKSVWRQRKRAARAEANRPKSFEEQLALVAAGKLRLAPTINRTHLEPRFQEDRRMSA